LQGDVLADAGIDNEHDPDLFELLDLPDHAILAQLESRDAVDQQAAGIGVGVVDDHGMALAAQFLGHGQAGRPAADHGHAPAGLRFDGAQRDAFGGVLVLNHELLDLANAHRLAVDAAAVGAGAFAQLLLRANPAANLRHGAGLAEYIGRPNEIASSTRCRAVGMSLCNAHPDLAGAGSGH
jgi:hypothetical protein